MASILRSALTSFVLITAALGLCACNGDSGSGTGGGTGQLSPNGLELVPVTVAGEKFMVELAIDEDTIVRGLGSRESIPDDGGMLFVFDDVRPRSFLMRDCLVDIDIAFLSPSGRVVAMHTMKVEPPRGEDEGEVGETGTLQDSAASRAYHERLPKYTSRYRAQFALELKAGTFSRLGVKEGDSISFDKAGLKKRAANADSR